MAIADEKGDPRNNSGCDDREVGSVNNFTATPAQSEEIKETVYIGTTV